MGTFFAITRTGLVALVLLVVGWFVPPAAAQQPVQAPLADRLPADAVLYVGWVGSERIAELWDGTHTQALVRQSNFEDLLTRYVPEVLDKLAQEEPEAAEAVQLARELVPLFVRRPSAFAFGGMSFNGDGGPPVPKLIFAVDAGDQAAALEQRIRALMRQADQQPLTMFVGNKNGIVRFAIGYDLDELDRLAAGEGANSLAASETFAAVMGGLSDSPTSAFFLDFPKLIAIGEEAARTFASPEEQAKVAQIIDTLGLRGLGQLAATNGFSGKMYETRGFLGVTGREGFLRLLPDGPLDERTLAVIPTGSTMVSASQMDFGALFDVMRQVIVEIEPGAEAEIDRALAHVNEVAGVNVEEDVLRQFGKTWGFYISPRIGNGMFSGVVVNRPNDPAKLDEALTSTSRNLLDLANEHIRPETEGNISLPGRSLDVNGQTLHILNLPLVAPTWAISRDSGLLQLALYPQSILSARAITGDSFMGSDAWQQMSRQLAPEGEVTGLTYVDLHSYAPNTYPLILMFSQGAFGAADLFGEKLGTRPPVVVLPPLATMLEHIEPSGAVSWMADDGIHFRSLEPFPMSGVLSMDVQSMALNYLSTAAGMAGASAEQAREAAERARMEAERARDEAERARQGAEEPD